jgi:hypothetical protein
MKKSKKAKKTAGTKSQLNPWGHFRSSCGTGKKTEHDSQVVELGENGVKFERRGGMTFALPCGDGADNSTVSAVKISYDILSIELSKVYTIGKASGGGITGAELRKQCPPSILKAVADQEDWDSLAEGFSPKNRHRGRPKGTALTFLERKMALNRASLKSYLSRAKNSSEQ